MFETYILEINNTQRLSYQSFSEVLALLTAAPYSLPSKVRNELLQGFDLCTFSCGDFRRLVFSITLPEAPEEVLEPDFNNDCKANCQGWTAIGMLLKFLDDVIDAETEE